MKIKITFLIFIITNGLLVQNNYLQPIDPSQIKFDHFTIEDGLANSTVKHIIQDRQGFMWFVALNALCRYDGYEFKTYKHNPKNTNSLSGDRINALVETADGELLIGTHQTGIDILNLRTEKITHYQNEENNEKSLGSNHVGAIYIDKSGHIWIGSEHILNLFHKTKGSFERYYLPDKNLNINSIIEYYKDELWIITDQLKIFRLNIAEASFTQLNIIPSSHSDPLIWRCNSYIDSKDILWICTVRNGLYRYDKRTNKLENFRSNNNNEFSISYNDVFDIIEDKYGNYWIATDGGGLNYFIYHSKRFYSIKKDPSNPKSIENNKPHCVFRDDNNIIWAGLYNGGVNVYDEHKEKFKSYTHNPNNPNSLSQRIVWSFFQDKEGDIIIGTDRGGINFYNPERYGDKIIRIPDGIKDRSGLNTYTCTSILQDSRGLIWIGTYNDGLLKYNKNNNTCISLKAQGDDSGSPYSPAGNNAWDIKEDSSGCLWIATLRDGVDVFNPATGRFIHYKEENSGLSNNEATTIYIDSQHRIWIGTAEGLNLYDSANDDFVVFRHHDNDQTSLPGNNIKTIFEDKAHRLWIGTEGSGICCMDIADKTCINYSEEDGLPSNVIYGILEDDHLNLWISTSNGLSRFDTGRQKFVNYTKKEGLPSNEFKQNSCLKTSDGMMFFGSINGFTTFHPDSITTNLHKPQIVITGFSINNKPVEIGAKGSPLTQSITRTKELSLTHKQSVFTLLFAALNYTIPEKNQYAYMLEKFDKEWNFVGNRREVTYTNLNPGKYVFKVMASNNDNVWNNDYTYIVINVLPPWWKTVFFRVSLLIFITGCAVLFYFFRINRIKRQKAELENQVAIRTNELKMAFDELKSKQEEILAQHEEILAQRDEIQKNNEVLEKAYNRIKTLNSFGQELTAVLNLEQINKMIFSYVSSLLDTSVLGIGVYDSKSESIVFTSLIEDGIPVAEFSSPLDDPTSCAAWCFNHQKHIFTNDFKSDYKNYILKIQSRSSRTPESLIYLPLTVKDKRIGIITVQSYKRKAYTENDLLTLQTIASYLAIALDNANAYEIVRLQKDELMHHHSRLESLVKERTKELEAAKSKAEESDKLKSSFLANMSHEIRTPLNAIVGFSNLLVQEESLDISKEDVFQIIEHNTNSLLQLVSDIIDYSKIEAGELTATLTEVDLNTLLHELYHIFKEDMKKSKEVKDIRFLLNLGSMKKSPVLTTDLLRLRQIISNLVDNAIKYTHQGYIEIGYKPGVDGFINVYVKDTGIGIERKNFEIIFERFRKIDEPQSVYRGAGLGLSITKQLVKMLGGKIWLESEPGKGSEFIFSLPCNSFKENPDKEPAYNNNKTSKPDWNNKLVLIVEDEISNYRLIKAILKPTRINVLWAQDGRQAMQIFKEYVSDINIILMDIKLPNDDGIRLAGEIRSIDSSVPIIANTAYALPEEEHKIRSAGFADYISKPIDRNKLFKLMSRHIR
ncbi:MAG: response regulator [Bacteroidales bacterium]|nr:response regulator [Bacteroidales bacterium]